MKLSNEHLAVPSVGSYSKLRKLLRPLMLSAMTALAVVVAPAWQPNGSVALAADDPRADAMFDDAADLHNQSQWKLAAGKWQQFVDQFPKDKRQIEATYLLGVCRLNLKEYPAAAAALQKVTQSKEKFADMEAALLNLGIAQFSMAEASKPEAFLAAADSFARVAKDFPKGKHAEAALFYQGEALYNAGKKPEAVSAYADFVAKFPGSKRRAEALFALGATQEEVGQSADASKTYDLLLKEFPKDPRLSEVQMRKADTLIEAGLSLEKSGKQDAAKTEFAKAEKLLADVTKIKDFNHLDHAIFRLALTQTKQGKQAEAAQRYARIVEEFPKSEYAKDSAVFAARLFYDAKDFEKAQPLLKKALEAGGSSAPVAAHMLCRIYLKDKQAEKAVDLASTQAANAPAELAAWLWVDRADALYELSGRKEDALAQYIKVATDFPKHERAEFALYSAAFTALELAKYEQALELAGKFAKQFAKSEYVADISGITAESHLMLKQYPEAEKAFRGLLSAHGSRSEAEKWKLQLGLTLFNQKKYADTAEHLAKLAEQIKRPESAAEALFMLGTSRFHLKDYTGAAKSLEAALAANPKFREADQALLNLGLAQEELKQKDAAKASFQKLLADYKESPFADQATYRLGALAFASEDFKQSASYYGKLSVQWPKSVFLPNALYGLGWSQVRLNDDAAGIASFGKLLTSFKDHALVPDAQYARALALRRTGKSKEAVADLTAFLKADRPLDEKSDAQFLRGLCNVDVKDYPAAADSFAAVLKENPKYRHGDRVTYQLAWANKLAKREDEALRQFTKLAADYPTSEFVGEAQYYLGEDLYWTKKDFTAALAAYDAAKQKVKPGELAEKSLYMLGWSNFQLKKFAESAKAFGEQVAAYPKGEHSADGLLMQAECLFNLEKYAEALPVYLAAQKATGLSKEKQEVIALHAAQSASALKKWEDSLKQLAEFAKLYPESRYMATVLFEQGWAMQQQKKLDEALALYKQSAEHLYGLRSAIGARATLMIGEIMFERKQYAQAIDQFKLVVFGFGGAKSADDVKPWQAQAAYEAGRCSEAIAEGAGSSAGREEARGEARQMYNLLLERFKGSKLAPEAEKRLSELK